METGRKANSLRIEVVITAISILLMLLVLGFTGGINIAAFEKNYTSSMVANYAALGGKTVQKIEYAVRYGKPINNFFGMRELLQKSKQDFKSIDDIIIVLKDKTVAYELLDTAKESGLSGKLCEVAAFNTSSDGPAYSYGQENGKYHVFLPVRDASGQWIASFDMVFDRQNIKQPVNTYIRRLFLYLSVIAVFGLILLFAANRIFALIKADGSINGRSLLIRLLIIMGGMQLIYGFVNYSIFSHAYRDIAEENAKSTAVIIQKDIESVIQKGVNYDELYKLDDYLKKTAASSEDIEEIKLFASDGRRVYASSNDKGPASVSKGQEGGYQVRLTDDLKGAAADIHVKISDANINAKMKNIIFDMLTVLVMAFFFMLELTLLVSALIKRRLGSVMAKDTPVEDGDIDMALLRGLSFVVFTCIFIPTAIIPVMMKDLYQPMLGLPQDIVLGLPITMAFFSSAVGMLASGSLIDKRGWKVTFLAGCSLIALGALVSALSTVSSLFILSRTVAGFGDGFVIMALRGFAASSKAMKSEGFAGLNIGLNSGINCGVFIGAMLAERIAFSTIFAVSIVIAIISILFAAVLMKNSRPDASAAAEKKVRIPLYAFFTDKRVLGLLALVIIPTAICGTFLNYYLPLYFKTNGISAANISRAYLLNGICIIGLTSYLCERINNRFGHKISSIIASLVIICAIGIFAVHGALVTALLVAAALGIAESFGIVAYDSYLLSLDAALKIGEGKALSYLNNAKRIGQMMGPIAFGSVAALGGLGVGAIGLIFLAATILFMVITRNDKVGSNNQAI